MTFALQYAIVACLASWGGSLADAQERTASSWGRGRVLVLTLALTLGTVAYMGHSIPEYMIGSLPENSDGTITMVWHIAMRCIYAVSMGIAAPCLDGLALAHLECMEGATTSDFGKERMYGALWWGIGSLAAGIGIDYFGFDFLYTFLAISLMACYAVILLYLWGLGRDTTGAFMKETCEIVPSDDLLASISRSEYEYKNEEEDSFTVATDGNILSNTDLLRMVCNTNYGRSLLFFTFTLAIGISVVDNLAFIFFDSIGASNTMNGWTVVFTVLFETQVFYAAPMLLERYGPGKLLLAAGFAYVIRVVGYTFVPDGKMYIVLLLETLHGVSYAGSKVGSVEFIARIIPRGYEAAGQGILIFVTYMGVVAGLIAAGWIQQTLGARVMFRFMAVIVSIGIAVLLIAECLHDEDEEADKEESDKPAGENSHLTQGLSKSESCASNASAFADDSAERYMRNIKYDSLNKYVKDW